MKLTLVLLLLLSLPGFSQDSLFTENSVPCSTCNEKDKPVELGLVFKPKVESEIRKIQLYSNVATDYIINVWTIGGLKLYSQNYTARKGLNTVLLNNQVNLKANETYVVSFYSPQGYYSVNVNFHASEITKGNLVIPSSNSVSGNGRYKYSSTSTFPTDNWNNTDYYIGPVIYPVMDVLPLKEYTETIYLIMSLDTCGSPKPFVNYTFKSAIGASSLEWIIDNGDSLIYSTENSPIITYKKEGIFVATVIIKNNGVVQKKEIQHVVVSKHPRTVITETLANGEVRYKNGNIIILNN